MSAGTAARLLRRTAEAAGIAAGRRRRAARRGGAPPQGAPRPRAARHDGALRVLARMPHAVHLRLLRGRRAGRRRARAAAPAMSASGWGRSAAGRAARRRRAAPGPHRALRRRAAVGPLRRRADRAGADRQPRCARCSTAGSTACRRTASSPACPSDEVKDLLNVLADAGPDRAPGHRGRPARRLRAGAHARGPPGRHGRAGPSWRCRRAAARAGSATAAPDGPAPRRGRRRAAVTRPQRHVDHGRRRPRAPRAAQAAGAPRRPGGRACRPTSSSTTARSWRSPRPSPATARPCGGSAGSGPPSSRRYGDALLGLLG